jgi:hypothetical protein
MFNYFYIKQMFNHFTFQLRPFVGKGRSNARTEEDECGKMNGDIAAIRQPFNPLQPDCHGARFPAHGSVPWRTTSYRTG